MELRTNGSEAHMVSNWEPEYWQGKAANDNEITYPEPVWSGMFGKIIRWKFWYEGDGR